MGGKPMKHVPQQVVYNTESSERFSITAQGLLGKKPTRADGSWNTVLLTPNSQPPGFDESF